MGINGKGIDNGLVQDRRLFVDMRMELDYVPKEIEEKWHHYWENNNLFVSEVDFSKKPFTVVLPAPNITGNLHIGHAFNAVLQDVMCRYKRMKGYNVLWIPGTDHGGIATQNVIQKKLASLNKDKDLMGKENFINYMWEWKNQIVPVMRNQLKRLGVSCDWTKEYFTMDDIRTNAVQEAFIKLYKDKYIYKEDSIVNWCFKCGTAISDMEIEIKETTDDLYYIKYYFSDYSHFVIVATKRVETIFGDCALAVHPDDKRYNDLVGKEVLIPLIDRKIPIICDESIGSSFGEGIVRITPAHVPNDYTIARRNKLPIIKVINAQGKMNEYAGKYTGLDRYECRKIITQYLQQNGLLVKKETVRGGIGYCYRCMTEIEPYLSKQWFFRVEELIEPAIELVKKNKLKFNDKKWEDSYLAWLNTLKNRSVSRQSWWEGACIAVILSFSNKIDWCISRQIWWGHKIPVWYCKSCKSENISAKKPEKCFVCRDDDLKQDDNVLDMWFSCALWPLSTLKWPKYSDQLKYYYPNSICVTGHDVIYFWIIPTILINLALMKTAPYSEVFVHGLVCDINGKKMSKSLGNTIEPHELINKYGADALRYALISQANTKGEDIKLSVEAVEKGYYFIKEIWRFSNSWKEILKNCVLNLYSEDNKIERFSNTNNEMNEVIASLKEIYQQVMIAIDNYDYAEVLKCLERFYYSKQFNDFSNYIKEKIHMATTKQQIEKMHSTFLTVFIIFLKLLHPILPFITEEVNKELLLNNNYLSISKWPEIYDFSNLTLLEPDLIKK